MLFGSAATDAAAAGQELADQPGTAIEHEFMLEQAEISSSPATELGALEEDLRASRRELIDAAGSRGILVAAIGSTPIGSLPTPTPTPRYLRMHETYGQIAFEQLTCGAHVHVGVESRAAGVTAIDTLRPWLSVLVALGANSPLWYGLDTGYASYRTISWGRWPTAGPTASFLDEAGYDGAVADLIDTGAALDLGMIYFDARLSARYPTVEFRVADVGQDVADDVLLAALCRALVSSALADPMADPTRIGVGLLRAATWRAARFGLTDSLYDVLDQRLRPAVDVVDRMLDVLAPELRRTGDHELVRSSVDRILARGTGAELQRRDLAVGGPAEVVRAAARRTAGS